MKRLLVNVAMGANLVAACVLLQACSKKQAASPETQLPDEQPPVEVQAIDDDGSATKAPGADKQIVKPIHAAGVAVDVQRVDGTTPYAIRKGDTITAIAYRYGLRWQDIVAVNPGLSPNKLRVGQIIQLPGAVDVARAKPLPRTVKAAPKAVSAASAAKTTAPKTTVAVGPTTVYIVKKGDMLSSIAHKYGVRVSAIRAANPKIKGDKIFVGQKLNVPAAAPKVAEKKTAKPAAKTAAKPAAKAVAKPVVKPAEKKVAAPKAAVTTEPAVAKEQVKQEAQPQTKKEEPAVEKKANTAAPSPAPAADSNAQTYTVKDGEDVYAVAIRWGVSPSDLKSLNNLTSTELKPGQVLKLPPNAQ